MPKRRANKTTKGRRGSHTHRFQAQSNSSGIPSNQSQHFPKQCCPVEKQALLVSVIQEYKWGLNSDIQFSFLKTFPRHPFSRDSYPSRPETNDFITLISQDLDRKFDSLRIRFQINYDEETTRLAMSHAECVCDELKIILLARSITEFAIKMKVVQTDDFQKKNDIESIHFQYMTLVGEVEEIQELLANYITTIDNLQSFCAGYYLEFEDFSRKLFDMEEVLNNTFLRIYKRAWQILLPHEVWGEINRCKKKLVGFKRLTQENRKFANFAAEVQGKIFADLYIDGLHGGLRTPLDVLEDLSTFLKDCECVVNKNIKTRRNVQHSPLESETKSDSESDSELEFIEQLEAEREKTLMEADTKLEELWNLAYSEERDYPDIHMRGCKRIVPISIYDDIIECRDSCMAEIGWSVEEGQREKCLICSTKFTSEVKKILHMEIELVHYRRRRQPDLQFFCGPESIVREWKVNLKIMEARLMVNGCGPELLIPDTVTELAVYCFEEENVCLVLDCLEAEARPSLEHLRLNSIETVNLNKLTRIGLQLKSLDITVDEDVSPLHLLNFLLTQRKSLEQLRVTLPGITLLGDASLLHEVYPCSDVLQTYSLICGRVDKGEPPEYLVCCSDVQNCKWKRHRRGIESCKSCVAVTDNLLLRGKTCLLQPDES